MSIKSTGEVGIGTTTPEYPLEVKNTKGASTIISSSRNTAGNLIAFTFEDATNDGKFYLRRGGETTNYTVLSANGNSYFNGGNVGIGTDTPAREIEVTGTGNVYARITAPTATDWSALELTNTNETWQIINDDIQIH
jgi:hypothetical protein